MDAQLTRTDLTAAHTRYFVGQSLLSYAAKLDVDPTDAVLARSHAMLEAEWRCEAPLGTWAGSPEPSIAWDHLFGARPSREW